MSGNVILGIVLLAVGVILLVFGFSATESLTEEVHEGVTGRYTDTTTFYLIAGAAGVVGGGLLLLFGRR